VIDMPLATPAMLRTIDIWSVYDAPIFPSLRMVASVVSPFGVMTEVSENPTFRELAFPHRIDAVSTRLLIGIAAIAGVSVCGLISTVVNHKMMDQVNGRLPKGVQFSPLGWYLPKTLRLHREYRRLFPDGRLLLQVRLLIALMFGSLMGCAWALGFFGR
jgi:hypothetical protein